MKFYSIEETADLLNCKKSEVVHNTITGDLYSVINTENKQGYIPDEAITLFGSVTASKYSLKQERAALAMERLKDSGSDQVIEDINSRKQPEQG